MFLNRSFPMKKLKHGLNRDTKERTFVDSQIRFIFIAPRILQQYAYYALYACVFVFMHSYSHTCEICVLGEEASIQVPQSVRQHLVRQDSVTPPEGKAAYCGHKP